MTPDERTLLTAFLRDLTAARGAAKDPEADAMIARALTDNPDAAYLLVQHTIVADQALHAAQARIAELEDQQRQLRPQQAPASRFLPSGGPWGAPASPPPQQQAQAAPQDPRGGYAGGGFGGGAFSGGGGLGSFLRGAGTTAAGVAGGELLFSGLSNLFGGHGGGFNNGSGFLGQVPENITINDYGNGDDADRFVDDNGGDFGGDDGGGDWS